MRIQMEYGVLYHETIEIFNQSYFKDYEYHTKREIDFVDYLKMLEKNYTSIIDLVSEIIDLHLVKGNSYNIIDENKELRDDLLFELGKYFEFYEILNKITNKKFENYFITALDESQRSNVTNKKEEKFYFESVGYKIYYNFITKNLKLFLEGLADEMINIRAIIRNKISEFDLINRPINSFETTTLFDSGKIKIKGSLQSIGYLFSELIDKGFIEAPKRNGKNNTSAISRMILDHFEFADKAEQPKPEDIRKTLFTDNKLSFDKQGLFKIPKQNILNEN